MSGPRLSEPQWQALESAAEARYSLPSGVLAKTRGIETGGRDIPGVPTKHGVAQGYYQTMPANVAKYGFNPHDPASAVDGTARLWRDNLSATGGNVQEAARMYNGSGPEARAYAAKFMGQKGGQSGGAQFSAGDTGFSDLPAQPQISSADTGFSDPGLFFLMSVGLIVLLIPEPQIFLILIRLQIFDEVREKIKRFHHSI